MILLIRHHGFRQQLLPLPQFKFHYDSINSVTSFAFTHFASSKFKFHYDSINSAQRFFTGELRRKNLNSIMILLIPDITLPEIYINDLFKFHYDSINSAFRSTICADCKKFKFHYDSINSRPKIIPLFKPKNVSILSTSSKFNISFLSLIIYFCNTSYFRSFRLLSIPYIFCTIMGRQKPLIFQVDFVRHILL